MNRTGQRVETRSHPRLAFIRLAAHDEPQLAELFGRLSVDPSARHFHPHPFDPANAQRICRHPGLDQYFALNVDDALLGYGMLRGWDEGFAVPSLGIYLESALRRTGASRAFMHYLHLAARLAGAGRIRLKVHPENVPALRLYRSLGYQFATQLQPDGQMLGTHDLSA